MEVAQLLISGISQGCVYGLIALGFVLIYKATEMVNFAQGDLMMLGAFLAFTFSNLLDLHFVWVVIATLLSLSMIGALTERLVLRPMIGEPPFSVLMITIGLGFIIRAVAGAIWGSEPRSLDTPYAGGVLKLGDVILGYENIIIILGTGFMCLLLYLFFKYTRLGVAMQASSQNQLAAYYVGIPVKRVYSMVWALSATISATAGILVAPVSLIDPMMGFIGIKAFAAAIVGGFGSLPGAILGGLLIGIVEQFAGLYLPPGFSDTSAYLILLLMLLIRPEGIFASIQRKKV